MSKDNEDAAGILNQLEDRLNLGRGFLKERYEDDDDWSFVVKTHALIEVAVSELLAAQIGDPRARPVFARLPLSDTYLGKLAFVKRLDLLAAPKLRFIRKFSELRNWLAHDVHNIRFNFMDHVAMLDSNQRKSFADWIWLMDSGRPPESILEDPRPYLWLSVLSVVAECVNRADEIQTRQVRAFDMLDTWDSSDEEKMDDDASENEAS